MLLPGVRPYQRVSASLDYSGLSCSHLFNKLKAGTLFKFSLTDEPGTPWTPTVLHLTWLLLYQELAGVPPARVYSTGPVFSPEGTVF